MIVTTANLDVHSYQRLISAHKESGIELYRIIHVLFKLIVNERGIKAKFFSRIKYQDRLPEGSWRQIHLYLNEGSYEACLDMRKVLKMSVSKILDYAVRIYLDRAIDELKRESSLDNYLENYIIFYTHSSKISNISIHFSLPADEFIPSHAITYIDPPD